MKDEFLERELPLAFKVERKKGSCPAPGDKGNGLATKNVVRASRLREHATGSIRMEAGTTPIWRCIGNMTPPKIEDEKTGLENPLVTDPI